MDSKFYKEALFAGMTGNGFSLGTVLSVGWFWVRRSGCCVLYRFESVKHNERARLLAVEEADVSLIAVPEYAGHESGRRYFYLVRRINGAGFEERTDNGLLRVDFGPEGLPAKSRPNGVFTAGIKHIGGHRLRLFWYYSGAGQSLLPESFNVYYDNSTGVFDYDNPSATVRYCGRRYYACEFETAEGFRHQFIIRVAGVNGEEERSFSLIATESGSRQPAGLSILKVKPL
jgi:hypothetical protein